MPDQSAVVFVSLTKTGGVRTAYKVDGRRRWNEMNRQRRGGSSGVRVGVGMGY